MNLTKFGMSSADHYPVAARPGLALHSTYPIGQILGMLRLIVRLTSYA